MQWISSINSWRGKKQTIYRRCTIWHDENPQPASSWTYFLSFLTTCLKLLWWFEEYVEATFFLRCRLVWKLVEDILLLDKFLRLTCWYVKHLYLRVFLHPKRRTGQMISCKYNSTVKSPMVEELTVLKLSGMQFLLACPMTQRFLGPGKWLLVLWLLWAALF